MDLKIDYHKIKRVVDTKSCPEHGKEFKCEVTKGGTNIGLESCCDTFHNKILDVVKSELKKQTVELTRNALKGLL